MDKQKRKELQEEYKKIKTYLGVIQITNQINNKIYIAGYPNLKNKWHTLQEQLNMGRHANSGLQSDWQEYGASSFTFSVLEEKDAGEINDVRWEVKQMEKTWLNKIQPYEKKGYNKPPKD